MYLGRPVHVWILYVLLAWIAAHVLTGAAAVAYLSLRLLLAGHGITI